MERRIYKILEWIFSIMSLLFLVLWVFLGVVPAVLGIPLYFLQSSNLLEGCILPFVVIFTNVFFILTIILLIPAAIFNYVGARMDKKTGNVPFNASDPGVRKRLRGEKILTKKQLKEKRGERFQKIVRNYEVISLKDMAKLLWFKDVIELQEWLMDAFEDSPMKIKKEEVVIHSGGSREEVEIEIDELLRKYRAWESAEFGKI